MKKLMILAVLIAFQSITFAQKKGNSGAAAQHPASKPKKVQAIDLMAESITFSLVRRIDNSRAIIKVEGTVKNVGTEAYVSGSRQQRVYMGEAFTLDRTSLNNLITTGRLHYTTLNPGAVLKVSYEREWNKSDEFPPFFVLQCFFQPSTSTDDTTQNDDGDRSNDRLVVDGKATINAMSW